MMEATSNPGILTGKTGTRTSQAAAESIINLNKGMDSRGQHNQAYDSDSCDSIDSLSDYTDSENSAEDDSITDVKEGICADTEATINSKTDVKEVKFADTEATSLPKQERSERKPWDVFGISSEDSMSSSTNECWNACLKIIRITFCSLLFMVVLVTSTVSKMTFLLMTANIFPSTTENSLKTLNGTLSYPLNSTDVRWIWSILITITAPYLFTILKYLWVLMKQRTKPMQWKTLIVAIILESFHTVGLCSFVLVVLPSFDPLTACVVSFCISPIPGILKILFPLHIDGKLSLRHYAGRLVNILAFIGQLTSIALLVYYISCSNSSVSFILTPMVILSPFLISMSWWENFVFKSSIKRCQSTIQWMFNLKKNMKKEIVRVGIITNIWKLILTLLIMPALLFGTRCKDGDACIRTVFFESSGKAEITIVYSNLTFEVIPQYECYSYLPFVVSVINVVSSAACYKCVKVASKILAQQLSYALPVTISTPVVIGLFLGIYSQFITLKVERNAETCVIPLPVWSNQDYDLSSIFNNIEICWPAILAGLSGFISFLIISNHVWSSGKARLIATHRIFSRALYSGVFLDQSLLLNRRRVEEEKKNYKIKDKKKLQMPDENDEQNNSWSKLREDDTPLIYMCATMWHESEVEMVQILKSIFRQDYDQCARKHVQLGLGIEDPDYYEFEAHIFFDDAFESQKDINGTYKVNSYVKQLISSVETAARSVTGISKAIDSPVRTNTPYGGRLEWRLPGENKLIAHLKDKTKIRHRKRWSQVMYMYYFLAHKLAKKRKVAENTFLLALDGDVDFQPKAVQLLVDRMRKNPNVGAACGRIHPIGTGPMVWYQQFEYAVSHWLQKSAENIMGCVLCSPGCFSLFRGSALMDDNVMAKYTTLPTEPRHYVQYDQGEDRWLCTLLLQQGYKVEYVAASDALTYAPEGFYEFYNQRRRWSPSTMANIIDLLMDWKNVTRKNEDISKLYILYQMFLMICSILTPGTIFLMILGAISMAFPTIPPFAGMLVNLIPVSGMIILCFVAKPNIQLAYAAVVSIFYSLLMMVVLVGILLEAVTARLCSVTTLFLLFVVGVFFISALLHPQEFYCVLHGFLYLLSIPSMSMLLMIYSLGNLHVISWGTRDTKETAPQLETNDRMPSRSPSFLKSFGFNGDEESEYLFTCGKFIRCCPIRPIRMILERLDNLEAQRIKTTVESEPSEIKLDENAYISTLNVQIDDIAEKSNPLFKEDNEFEHEQMSSQSWMDDSDLKQGSVAVLDKDKTLFWEEFISKYLKPLYTDKKHEEQMRQGLKELRNKVCLAFLLMNALFVTIVYVLTEVNASFNHALSIKLPCTVSEGPPGRGYIEPISIAFTAIFGIMLFLQFICMLMHRMSTLVHIVASVKLNWKRKLVTAKNKDQPENVEVEVKIEDGLELVKGLQAVKEDDTISIASTDTTYSVESYVRSKQKSKTMWKKYQKRLKKQTQQQNDYCLQFTNNLKKFTEALEKNDNKSVQKLLENKVKGKTITAVSTILKNDTKINEIKIRTTALNKKEVVKRRWQDFGAKVGLNKEDENDENPGKFFKDVTKAALAQERRKRLEEGDISLGETNVNKIKRETSESRRDISLDIMKRGTDENNSIPEQITSVKTTEL